MGRRFLLELPDGSRREGRFDSRGRVRLEHVTAGTCRLTLPSVPLLAQEHDAGTASTSASPRGVPSGGRQLTPNPDGSLSPVLLETGMSHPLVLPLQTLLLERRYHDDEPLQRAPFEVELDGGRIVKGQLDDRGRARLRGLGKPVRVRFGPDARDWKRVDEEANPDYREELSPSDIEALVSRSLTRP